MSFHLVLKFQIPDVLACVACWSFEPVFLLPSQLTDKKILKEQTTGPESPKSSLTYEQLY